MTRKDRLFESEITQPGDFVFDDRVVSVFPDMINRSVPGYSLIVPLIGMLARRYAQQDSRLYDLGCSLGAVSLAMRTAVRAEGATIVAVDNSIDMVRQLESILASDNDQVGAEISVVHQDIVDTEIVDASVVVLNFTLQFIDRATRSILLNRIYNGLRPGGILVLSEKITFEDPAERELQTCWHHDFKRAQGYTELEISRKRDALENVLKPDTMRQHTARLNEAGFDRVLRWYQGFNFISMAALK
jgi:tRNA (cmo5U34)-methyltransferase